MWLTLCNVRHGGSLLRYGGMFVDVKLLIYDPKKVTDVVGCTSQMESAVVTYFQGYITISCSEMIMHAPKILPFCAHRFPQHLYSQV